MKHLNEVTALVVTTHWDCGVGDCPGEMLPDGKAFPTTAGMHPHSCSECRRLEEADKRYPLIKMTPVQS